MTDKGKTGYNGHCNGQHKPGRKHECGCPGESRETQIFSEESALLLRVIGTHRVLGTLKSSNVKLMKSMIGKGLQNRGIMCS